MKKLLLIGLLFLMSSCYERGEVIESPQDFIIIHGKTYKLMSIIPEKDGNHPIWILYPKDSLDSQPEVINWEERVGKTTRTETLIKVE